MFHDESDVLYIYIYICYIYIYICLYMLLLIFVLSLPLNWQCVCWVLHTRNHITHRYNVCHFELVRLTDLTYCGLLLQHVKDICRMEKVKMGKTGQAATTDRVFPSNNSKTTVILRCCDYCKHLHMWQMSAVPMSAVPMSAMSAVPMSAVPMSAVPMSAVPMSAVPMSAQCFLCIVFLMCRKVNVTYTQCVDK